MTMVIIFMSSKDSDAICTKNTKSSYIKIMMGNETDKIIEELFEFLLQRYQEQFEEKMRRSEFVFDSVDLLHCNLDKISLNEVDDIKILLNG